MDSKWNVIKQKLLTDTFLKHLDYKPKSIQQEPKIEIAKINNEQTRMVNLIKKLYNIKASTRNQQ